MIASNWLQNDQLISPLVQVCIVLWITSLISRCQLLLYLSVNFQRAGLRPVLSVSCIGTFRLLRLGTGKCKMGVILGQCWRHEGWEWAGQQVMVCCQLSQWLFVRCRVLENLHFGTSEIMPQWRQIIVFFTAVLLCCNLEIAEVHREGALR